MGHVFADKGVCVSRKLIFFHFAQTKANGERTSSYVNC